MAYQANFSGMSGFSARDIYPNLQGSDTQSEAANPEPSEQLALAPAPTQGINRGSSVDSGTHFGIMGMIIALVAVFILIGMFNG